MKLKSYIFFYFLIFLLNSCFNSYLLAQRIMEKPDRSPVAVRTSENSVFLSWRMLAGDDEKTAFNIYRDNVKINDKPIRGISNFTDSLAINTSVYSIRVLNDQSENGEKIETKVLNVPYIEIKLNVPAAQTMPNGTVCTYSPNDCSTGDLDGDGTFELIVKWDPNNSKDNSKRGFSGNVYLDAYSLNGKQLWRIDLGRNIRAGAHYTQFLVADFDGNGRSELVCKTAPGTIDGKGNFIHQGAAFGTDHQQDYRNNEGYVLSGPEYLTVFDGLNGEEIATGNYMPARGNIADWGDVYGNRVDRFLGGIAWLDGILPSIIMCRGYYTRAVVAAWDFRNGLLTSRWTYDSGTSPGSGLFGQGNHNLSIGDVDQDGKDEIIWGSGALDDDGSLMYRTGLGHGDAMHLSDLDPDRQGYEVWTVHENKNAKYGQELHDAKTGEIIWGTYTGSDNGRGLAANISSAHRGFEMWSASVPGVANCKGDKIFDNKPSTNFRIYWDGDPEDELLNGNTITKLNEGNLFTALGCSSNNSTKSTPNLSADIIGDWREELVLRTSDNSALRIYTTTIPTSIGIYTLMQDEIYRNSIAWQNVAYNQPPHTGFYMGSDMDGIPPSSAYQNELRWNNGKIWDLTSKVWKDSLNRETTFHQHQKVLFDLNTTSESRIIITEKISPQNVKINSPANISFSGQGQLSGSMSLVKTGSGILEFNNDNTYTGKTSVWAGKLINNGKMTATEVSVFGFAFIGGTGEFNQLHLYRNTSIQPGKNEHDISTITILHDLTDHGGATYHFDIQANDKSNFKNDFISISGKWKVEGKSNIVIHWTGKKLPKNNYTIGKCASFEGNTENLEMTGIPDNMKATLQVNNGNIVLSVRKK